LTRRVLEAEEAVHLPAAIRLANQRGDVPAILYHTGISRIAPRQLEGAKLRRVFAGIRSRAAAEAAIAALRGRSGRALAARLLFGDGSFPDVGPRLAATIR